MSELDLDGRSMPCLVCQKPVETADGEALRENANWNKAVECRSYGNWGSQIHDMGGCLIFVVCDACVIARRGSMIHVDRVADGGPDYPDDTHKRRPRTHHGVTTGREHFESWFKAFGPVTSETLKEDEYLRTINGYFKGKTCLGCKVMVFDPEFELLAPNDPNGCLCRPCAGKAFAVQALARIEPVEDEKKSSS